MILFIGEEITMTKKMDAYQKIIIFVSSVILAGAILMSVSSYLEASQTLRQEINQRATAKVEYLNEKVGGFFEKQEILLKAEAAFAEQHLSTNAKGEEIIERLERQKDYFQKDFRILDIYIGYPDGSIESGSGWENKDKNWKSNERVWYVEAEKRKGEIAYSNVYLDSHTDMPVVTMSKWMENGDQKAVIAIDISLGQLIHLLENEKLGENGYPFILDKEGRFIVHPQYSFHNDIKTADTIFNISSGNLKELGSNLLNNEMEMFRAAYQGNQKVYLSKKLGNTDFYLIAGMDQKEMRIQLNMILMYNVFISAIAIFGFILVLLLLYKRDQNMKFKDGM